MHRIYRCCGCLAMIVAASALASGQASDSVSELLRSHQNRRRQAQRGVETLHQIPTAKLETREANLLYWADSYDAIVCYREVTPFAPPSP